MIFRGVFKSVDVIGGMQTFAAYRYRQTVCLDDLRRESPRFYTQIASSHFVAHETGVYIGKSLRKREARPRADL